MSRFSKGMHMKQLNQEVEAYKKEHVLDLYKHHPDEITRDFINEKEMSDDYEGREVLELLQNAVDQVQMDGKIHIGLTDDILIVANTGEPFSFPGVRSLMKSNLSPKRLSKNTIGQKGLGFRSLLNWSNDISIYSENLSVRFSEEYRKSFFEVAGITEPTALLVAPEVVESIDKNGYDTVIKIKIGTEAKITEVKRQLLSIDKYTLLFLNKINVLTVRIQNQVIEFKRESDRNIVIISENDEQYIFNTYSKNGMIDSKNYEIVIAYDESIAQRDNRLYSYFETNISFPIKWKCHATFELETTRSGIKKSDNNLKLLSEVASFICDKASKLDGNNNNPYKAFDSLLKTSDFPAGLNIKGIDFNDTYQRFFEAAKVLPTYSGTKISLNDRPIFYTTTQFFFTEIKNNNILIESQEKKRNAIIEEYSTHFDDEILMEIINDNSYKWNVAQKITVFLWWEREFPKTKFLPKLVKASDGDYLDVDTIVYFVRGRDLNIPAWSRIYQLDPLFEHELKKQLQEIKGFADELSSEPKPIIERVIARNSGKSKYSYDNKLIPHIIFRDADAFTILTPINSSVDKNYEYAKLFVKWLWDNYSDKEDWTAPLDLTFNLPNNNNSVERAPDLYFDEKYDNPLGNKLFINEKYTPFICYEEIGIHHNDMQQFKKFIRKLGVLEFPPLIKKTVQDIIFRKLYSSNYLINKLPRHEPDARNPYLSNVIFNVIEDLEELLVNLTTDEILSWIMCDTRLRDELNLKHSGRVFFNYKAQIQAYRSSSFDDYAKSYIKHVFQNSRWLEIDGKKYAPKQCVFAYSGLDITTIVPTVTNQIVKKLSNHIGVQQKEVRSFLTDVGVNKSIIGLESDDFYHVLLELPRLDESGQVSEKIYREIIDMDGDISTSSLNHDKFIKKGYVFTQNHDGKKYHRASDSYFSNSIQVNIGNHHIMRIPIRNGSFEVFNRIFGVRKFEEKYKVKRDSIVTHQANSEFQKYFQEFISYARAWSERNENIKKRLNSIRLQIVSQITLVDNNKTKPINKDYSLITDKNSWLIFVDEKNSIDYREISKCIEELFAQIANTSNSEIPNQLGELFRDCEGRRFLVEKHFGTIDAVNQTYQNHIRENLAYSLDMPYDHKMLDSIDFNNFSSIDNCSPLIDLLLYHEKDLEDINVNGFEYGDSIDFRPYYQSLLRDYIFKNEETYKNKLYLQYMSRNLPTQKSFFKEYLKFKNFFLKIEDIQNSAYYDFESEIRKRFPNLDVHSTDICSDCIYDRNFKEISTGFDVQHFGDFIDEHYDWKSLLFFLDDEISELIRDNYKNQLELESLDKEKTHCSQTNSDGVILKKSKINPVDNQGHKPRSTTGGNPYTRSSIEKRNKTKDKTGKTAEKMVRDKLKTIIPSLRWTSENSDIPSERNTSTLYDMEYLKDGQKLFVEVKSTTRSFYMSLSEYSFAKANSDNYELYLVDPENNIVDGPHSLGEFESSKLCTEFQFFFENE
jgi:hypothetical protein